jgi:hypothetical protein
LRQPRGKNMACVAFVMPDGMQAEMKKPGDARGNEFPTHVGVGRHELAVRVMLLGKGKSGA